MPFLLDQLVLLDHFDPPWKPGIKRNTRQTRGKRIRSGEKKKPETNGFVGFDEIARILGNSGIFRGEIADSFREGLRASKTSYFFV